MTEQARTAAQGQASDSPPPREPSTPAGRGLQWSPGTVVALAVLGAGVLMRLNNAVRYPSLHGFDSYAHVTYVWELIKTGRVPLPSDGWGRFHPPFNYALCAWIWQLLGDWEPKQVLKVLSLLFAMGGIGCAAISYNLTREYFSGARFPALLAAGFVLFLPAHIYTAPMFGNENLNILLCSVAVLCLVRTMQTLRLSAAIGLGVVMGLALLTKFTAIVCAAGAGLALVLEGIYTGRWYRALGLLCLVAALSGAISGWFYLRNVGLYGTPFKMSREYSVTRRIEQSQATGKRGIAAYTTFDPRIFKEPNSMSAPVVNSVWTGLFLSTWFDSFQNWFLPYNETTKAVARVLLLLGIIPTLLTLLGIARCITRILYREWEEIPVAMVTITGFMVAAFVAYTYENRIASAVKASYMLPAIVPFSFCFALGVDAVAAWGRRWLALVVVELLVLVAVIVPVYTYQLVFEVPLGAHYWNTVAVVNYFAGFRDKAYEMFSSIAKGSDLYLAHENMASIALEEGRTEEALREIKRAMNLVRRQAIGGTGEGTAQLIRGTMADYYNTLAVIYDLQGHPDLALQSAQRAAELDPGLPEASYNLAVLMMKHGLAQPAIAHLRRATQLDPGFSAAFLLLGAAQERVGDCKSAVETLNRALAVKEWPRRRYPHATGTGDIHDAAIVRRRRIRNLPPNSNPRQALESCKASQEMGPTARHPVTSYKSGREEQPAPRDYEA